MTVSTFKFNVTPATWWFGESHVPCAAYWGFHKARILRVLERGNLTGQMLMGKHRQTSLEWDHVLRVICSHEREGNEAILGHTSNFEAHLCDEACANVCAVACN